MKICLLHNDAAGDGASRDELRALLESHGHELIHIVDSDGDLQQALDDNVELVVAAGGDGTVARAADALHGTTRSLALLPLGTANNIASSLGIDGNLSDMVARWRRARPTALDLGIVHGSWGESRFIEGMGAGLVPSGIATMDAEPIPDGESTDERIKRALSRFLDIARNLKPRPWRVVVDGHELHEELLLLEVLNMRAIGPNLRLTRSVNPSDGKLSLVTAGVEHRAALVTYLENRLDGQAGDLRLPTRLVQQVEIEGLDEIHIDDAVRHWPTMGAVSVGIEPAAIRVLL